MIHSPTVTSSFAGCGRSSLGYKPAAFKELLAIDLNETALKSLYANLGCHVWMGDVSMVSGMKIMHTLRKFSAENQINQNNLIMFPPNLYRRPK